MSDTLLHRFQKNWKAKHSTTHEQTFLLTVSGGVDSIVLSELFLASKLKFAIAHCNFQLRGAEADKDEELVKEWCAKKNVVFHTVRFDTADKAAEWKKGIQETARILRYEWFEIIRTEHNYSKIATAHHANDNVETLMINLFKGTGISGIHGILPESGNIIRPLLFAEKDDIYTFAAANNIAFREDASNAKDDYLRNAVRLNIIPAIKEQFPNVIANVQESIGRFGQVEQLYKKAIEQERKKLVEQRGQDHYIPVLKLRQRQPLETICYEIFLPYNFTAAQLPHILNLLDAETGRFITSSTHRIIRNRDFLIVTTLPTESTDIIVVDAAPCTIHTGNATFSFSIEDRPIKISTDVNTAYLDMKHVSFPVLLRKSKMGDYFYPFGMKMKKKKVSRYLIDEKVPLHEKEHIWVIECSKRIAWIAGMRFDERFKVKDTTEKVLVIKRTVKP